MLMVLLIIKQKKELQNHRLVESY
ncbi:uncharacterized protein METZ01_LOCUS269724 [marine metagenome]|uniref:Uncharacterized protein n=1 Tax=marine metagenome TaxID=408172 RepID=A0A382JXL0_9ZZZZ